MNVEYTGRQYEVTPAIRKQVETSLGKLSKLLGDNFESKVILSVEKHRCKAEITVNSRANPLVGLGEASEMNAAVGGALDRIERQAIKQKTRFRARKRQARKKFNGDAQTEEMRVAVGSTLATSVPVVVHTYPALARTTEAHIVHSSDSVAMRPLSVEEAIKEAQFRDRDVFVFRDPSGKVRVLHRTKDGKMELIDAP